MRWIWIDKFEHFDSGKSAVAVKCVTMAEEHLHHLYPAYPLVPHSLLVEGFAQTAGILVGQVRQFQEKVVLAKITKATFHHLLTPGQTVRIAAKIDQFSDHGASCSGSITTSDSAGQPLPIADIQMMFSHVDKNMQQLNLPEHNFVFSDSLTSLLRGVNLYGASHASPPSPDRLKL